MTKIDAIELLRCAQYNLENTIKLLPTLKSNAFFQLAKVQLDEGLKFFEVMEEIEELRRENKKLEDRIRFHGLGSHLSKEDLE